MLIGVPKEVKPQEYRVGLTPASVRELVSRGHEVIIETSAGVGIKVEDSDYIRAGARIVNKPEDVFADAEMVVKVKEPQPAERAMLRKDQILFTYLHLAPDPEQTADLIKSQATCIAYETVVDRYGRLPLLAPMSQVAGRLAVQAGAYALEITHGGRGVLMGGVPGVPPAKVVIIGGGFVGSNSVTMALGLGGDVTVFDNNLDTLVKLEQVFTKSLRTIYSTTALLEEYILDADLIIGAVLVPGAAAPKLVTAEQVKKMKKGAVLVDVSIDQGGCFETSRPTSHDEPTYIIDDVVHYCVANMPGAVPVTSTEALNNATLPYVIALADRGLYKCMEQHEGFRAGLNVHQGHITHKAVADALKYPYVAPLKAMGIS